MVSIFELPDHYLAVSVNLPKKLCMVLQRKFDHRIKLRRRAY